MKWEMEIEEVEAVLEKIWDLHDKLSDAIHSISRIHYLNSIKSLRKSDDSVISRSFEKTKPFNNDSNDNHQNGFVFVKGFRVQDDDSVMVHEAKSLNAIRTALENLEDQLEFFHTVQTQQRAERDAAVARLEQSRIVLAMRLAEHQGKKYKVIEEALAFVGDVQEASQFISPQKIYGPSGNNFVNHEEKRTNILIKVLVSSFNFAKKSLTFDHVGVGGILGNAALVAVSMLALLHLNQVASKDKYSLDLPKKQGLTYNRNGTKVSRPEGSMSGGRMTQLDVLLARG